MFSPGAGGDLGERQAGVAVRLQDLEAGVEDPLPGAGRRPPGRVPAPDPAASTSAGAQAAAGSASIAGSRPIAASFFESAFVAYSKTSDEW